VKQSCDLWTKLMQMNHFKVNK